MPWMVEPYSSTANYRISRGRRVVENTFGIRDTGLMCMVLHNMLRTHQVGADRAPTPANDVAALQNEQAEYLSDDNYSNPSKEAKHQPKLLKDYFSYAGALFIYLFGVIRRFQHCTGHITMGSWKGRGNQYIQFARDLYCKLPTNGKQLPAFPLKAMTGIEPRPQRWEARVLPLCHRGPLQGHCGQDLRYFNQQPLGTEAGIYQSFSGLLSVLFRTNQLFQKLLFRLVFLKFPTMALKRNKWRQ